MSRQVDIKALVSHIVKGDGKDRCRICMGDTSEGQVFLGDTVMMDGDKPVTLAELLEVITGVEVAEDVTLPNALCCKCHRDTVAALHFKQLCTASQVKWHEAVDYIAKIPATDRPEVYYVFFKDRTIVKEGGRLANLAEAVHSLNWKLQEPKLRPARRRPKPISACRCMDCGKGFKSPIDLSAHLKNSLKTACTLCGRVLPKKSLRRHCAKKHGAVVFDCAVCLATFSDESEYKQHCNDKHGPGKLSCTYCGRGFSSERGLAAHTFAHTLFHCASCGASFENRKCFLYHRKQCGKSLIARPEVFKCDYCGMEYDRKQSLSIHIVHKHMNLSQYVCHTCGKRTSTLEHLASHQKVHKTERTTFECFCGAKFVTDVGYKLHQRIHTGEKPYKCEACGDRFLSASRRRDHMKRRHKTAMDTSHACDLCPAKFVRPWELRKHCLIVHCVMKGHIERKQETMRRVRNAC